MCIIEPPISLNLDDFKNGNMIPKIVIEIGLDYKLSHLMQDFKKLKNSGIVYPYLIHLVREIYTADNYSEVEDFVTKFSTPTAYARVSNNGVYYKKLDSKQIQFYNPKP